MSFVEFFFLILLNITCITTVVFIVKLSLIKDKNQSQRFFLLGLISIFIWCSGFLPQVYAYLILHVLYMPLTYYYTFGSYLVPVFGLLFIISLVKAETNFNRKLFWLFLIPLIRYVFTLTNDYHHLMWTNYALDDSYVFEKLMFFFTYVDLLFWGVFTAYLIYYLFNNFEILFKQSLYIILSYLIPIVLNVITVFKSKEFPVPLYALSTSYFLSLLIIHYSITKFNLLKVNPISLKTILNVISDCFIIIDRNFKVIGYNRAFLKQCNAWGVDIKNNFIDNFSDDKFVIHLEKVLKENSNVKFEYIISRDSVKKYYLFEILPLKINHSVPGIVIIFKDVTEIAEKNLQLEKLLDELKGTQDLLILNERFSSLGMLFGGLAHNLKSPLMTISANINILQELVFEYKTAITNSGVIIEDHKEIAMEMENWLGKTKISLEYISNTLNSIKGQIGNSSNQEKFRISEVLERVNLITKYEFNNQKNVLKISNLMENDMELNGSLNYLGQVINTLIMNAKQAYQQEDGIIEFSVYQEAQNIIFRIKDFGIGIPNDVQNKLFKEMVTTKGKDGTGLGLYISYSIIKSQFKGDIRFESETGKGSVFYISIPI